ncbi:hypothetical protein PsorP6_006848 [Peronosclerospora sorghi]|uniref:Uncharacterized protein n=1 Tax=Peronosclerospora sorghi TaxID=230839 RepID=A0ACC0WBM1_9STRA|nr:hypothetical protein PsorP6_006848 [Peronosclerospora sorghi]
MVTTATLTGIGSSHGYRSPSFNDSRKESIILAGLRGSSTRSVSLGWVQRFKKRHRRHRSQSVIKCASAPLEQTVEEHPVELAPLNSTGVVGDKRIQEVDEQEQDDEKTEDEAEVSCARSARRGACRKQFVSADDILPLLQVNRTKPWTYPQLMDGWQNCRLYVGKTARACKARVALLLDHLVAGNGAALRKSGTPEEYEETVALGGATSKKKRVCRISTRFT